MEGEEDQWQLRQPLPQQRPPQEEELPQQEGTPRTEDEETPAATPVEGTLAPKPVPKLLAATEENVEENTATSAEGALAPALSPVPLAEAGGREEEGEATAAEETLAPAPGPAPSAEAATAPSTPRATDSPSRRSAQDSPAASSPGMFQSPENMHPVALHIPRPWSSTAELPPWPPELAHYTAGRHGVWRTAARAQQHSRTAEPRQQEVLQAAKEEQPQRQDDLLREAARVWQQRLPAAEAPLTGGVVGADSSGGSQVPLSLSVGCPRMPNAVKAWLASRPFALRCRWCSWRHFRSDAFRDHRKACSQQGAVQTAGRGDPGRGAALRDFFEFTAGHPERVETWDAFCHLTLDGTFQSARTHEPKAVASGFLRHFLGGSPATMRALLLYSRQKAQYDGRL